MGERNEMGFYGGEGEAVYNVADTAFMVGELGIRKTFRSTHGVSGGGLDIATMFLTDGGVYKVGYIQYNI